MEWINLALQALALVVAIIMPMIDWPPPPAKYKRRKPRKRRRKKI